jgi:hypothetical protein
VSRAAVSRLAAAGVLTERQIDDTVAGILAVQRPDGAIPWFRGGRLDTWDHVEAAMALDAAGESAAALAAYRWLARTQNPDGSCFAGYVDAASDGEGVTPTDRDRDANFSAYLAVGVWHHVRVTADRERLAELWPAVRAALDFVLELQRADGTIAWHRDEHGVIADESLLAGNCSMYQALRCGLACANELGSAQPDWEVALGRLGHAITDHPDRFTAKDRYAMDWYYPMLGGVLGDAAAERAFAAGWSRFVVPGEGARCVDDQPWVTGGETAELAMALAARGDITRARALLIDINARLRADDGSYWTGYVFRDEALWPDERATWTAASFLLGLALIAREPATLAVFAGADLPRGLDVSCDSELCEER